jgi:hypothetical protein
MDTYDDSDLMTRLQLLNTDEWPSGREQELIVAAEAHHRLRFLNEEQPRLEHLAEDWIELIRASSGKL